MSSTRSVLGFALLLVLAVAIASAGAARGARGAAKAGGVWYVDPGATGSGNGTSWANAWTSPASISWGSVQPGDTVYLSGGATSKTYAMSWSVNDSGTASAPITIAVDASSPSHDGTVIFDYNGRGDSATSDGITLNGDWITFNGDVGGANHIQVNNLRNTGSARTAVAINGDSQNGITIDHLTFINDNNPLKLNISTNTTVRNSSFQKVRGDAAINVAGTTGTWDTNRIYNNYIEMMCQFSPSVCPGPDGIQLGSGTSVYNNTFKEITTTQATSSQHPDMLQTQGHEIKIYANEFINVGDSVFDYGYFTGQDPALRNVWIFDNVFHIVQDIDPYPEFIRIYANPGTFNSMNNFKILNNTFADDTGGFDVIRIDHYNGNPTASGNEIKNNIFYNCGGGSPSTAVISVDDSSGFTSSSFSFDNNVYYNPSGTQYVVFRGTTFTTTSWVASKEPHGKVARPQFVSYSTKSASNDFHLTLSDTVARDAGADFSSMFTTDKDGVTRPAGAWDIGAYEAGGSPPPPPPPPPPPGDTTAPTVSITAPAAGATVSGTTTVSANASDNVGVVGVQFKLDGANLGAEDGSSPYSVAWDTTTASKGTHTLTAIARDAAGNTASSTITVRRKPGRGPRP